MPMTRIRVFAVRLIIGGVVQFLALLVLGSCGTILCAQTVDIKLVNGRNGRPMTDACVNVWMGNERKTAMAIPTDESGIARLRLTHNDSEIDIHNRWKGCGDFGVVNPVVKYDDSLHIRAGYVCYANCANLTTLGWP